MTLDRGGCCDGVDMKDTFYWLPHPGRVFGWRLVYTVWLATGMDLDGKDELFEAAASWFQPKGTKS